MTEFDLLFPITLLMPAEALAYLEACGRQLFAEFPDKSRTVLRRDLPATFEPWQACAGAAVWNTIKPHTVPAGGR